jgi:hypothetical protein
LLRSVIEWILGKQWFIRLGILWIVGL